MKRIGALLLLVIAFVLNTEAQSTQLGKEMKAFYDYCYAVRSSVQAKDLSALEKCIVGWNREHELTYNGVQIKLDILDSITSTDSLGQTGLDGHLQFSPVFIDSLIVYGTRLEHFPNIEECMKDYAFVPELDRAGYYDCAYSHVCIKAGKQVTLSLLAFGDCELFLMSENGAEITASIALASDNKVFQKATSDAPCFKWNMECGRYILTVLNPTDKDISVIIASN